MDRSAPRTGEAIGLNVVEFGATIATFATGAAFVVLSFIVWFSDLGALGSSRGEVGTLLAAGGWLLGTLASKWDELSIPRLLALTALSVGLLAAALAAAGWWSYVGTGMAPAHAAAIPVGLFPLLLGVGRVRMWRNRDRG